MLLVPYNSTSVVNEIFMRTNGESRIIILNGSFFLSSPTAVSYLAQQIIDLEVEEARDDDMTETTTMDDGEGAYVVCCRRRDRNILGECSTVWFGWPPKTISGSHECRHR